MGLRLNKLAVAKLMQEGKDSISQTTNNNEGIWEQRKMLERVGLLGVEDKMMVTERILSVSSVICLLMFEICSKFHARDPSHLGLVLLVLFAI
jgi:hypothetical protein